MISRRLVRIKAVQTYYAFVQGNYDGSLEKVQEALEMSLDKSYELFAEMFCLIVAIADHAEYKIEFNRNKLLPTEEDLNPNRKFVDNRIIQAFRSEPTIKKYMEKSTSNWSEHYEFVRNIFNKTGGNLGTTGSVSRMFERKGVIEFDAEKVSEEEVMDVALEAGAEDIVTEDGIITVTTAPNDFTAVMEAFEAKQKPASDDKKKEEEEDDPW